MNCLKTGGISHGLSLTLALALGLGVFGSLRANAQMDKIHTIDSQAVMELHPAFQDAMEEYQKKMQEMQQQMQDADKEQQQMMQQMMQQQMQQLGAELQEKAFTAMQEDIQEYADEKGYGTILDKNVVIVGGKEITDEVIEELDLEPPEPDESMMPGSGSGGGEGEGEAPVAP